MKKVVCIALCCLLLAGCGNQQASAPEEPQDPAFEANQPTLSPTEPEDPEQILAYRRDVVESEMRRCMSILWTPAEDFSYSLYSGSMGPEIDMQIVPDRVMHMKAGRIYQGVPYTHGSGSVYSFLEYATAQDENGVYTISGMPGQALTGYPQDGPWSQARLGSDCVDTVFWAWSKVSNSITFTGTGEMTEHFGCVKVGQYQCNEATLTTTTKPIVQENGTEVMYQAYSQLQKGDALVLYTKASGGHAVMISDLYVQYTPGGEIDGEASYVVIIEHTSASQKQELKYFHEGLQQDVYICGGVDTRWSFSTIYSKGYLPVTCKELIDPAPVVKEEASLSGQPTTLDELLSCGVNASYRIANVTVTITQGDKVIQEGTLFGRELSSRQLSLGEFLDTVEQNVILGGIDPEGLKPGSYHCKVTCRLSTGNLHTLYEFDFKE